jgi:hypothetical protein
MYNCKHIFFYVLFLIVIPFQFITAQNTSTDGSQNNELDNKYDSVISKAAFSLTSAQYKQASDYYKEASLLKPQEMYPHKMIKYVEGIMTDEAAKQKRINDLTQKAQIKNVLNKANKAIVNGSWDSARLLFTEILTLNPSKTDEDYAKSKIEAIDLELKRIVLRTPPKPEPVVIAPPKNRSEARARRKLAERNALIASLAAKEKTQDQTQAPPPQKTILAPANKAITQKPTEIPLPQKTVVAPPPLKAITQKPIEAPLPQKTVVAAPPVEAITQKPIEAPLLQKTVVAAPPIKAITQKPIEAPLPQKTVVAPPPIKEIQHKPIEAPLPQKTVAATPLIKEITQKQIETPLPQKTVAAAPPVVAITQKPIEVPLPQKTLAAPPPIQEITQKQIEAPLPQKTVAAAPPIKEIQHKPIEVPLPKKNVTAASLPTKALPQKSAESSMPQTNAPAPFSTEPVNTVTGAPLLNLADSSDYIKLICKDITFIGTNAYVKVLIQNYSETASFLTDTLLVSLKKNNGAITKLDQRFIAGFPVVAPLKELIMVSFADASVGVDPDDTFILEMKNKTSKTKLSLQIPWALYKQQKNL